MSPRFALPPRAELPTPNLSAVLSPNGSKIILSGLPNREYAAQFLDTLPYKNYIPSKNACVFELTPASAHFIMVRFPHVEADQAVLSSAQQWVSSLADAARVMAATNLSQPPQRKFDAWPWQLRGYHYGSVMPAAMIAIAMGGGKTKLAVDIMVNHTRGLILILCPVAVMGVWRREVAKHSDLADCVIVLDTKESVKKKVERVAAKIAANQRLGRCTIVVVNYETAWRSPFAELVLSLMWDLVIADECHPRGVQVETPSGLVPIEKLSVGDTVFGIDHETGSMVKATVTRTFRRFTKETIVRIGSTKMTSHHPVWTLENGYVPALNVTNSHTLCRIDHEEKTDFQREEVQECLQMLRQGFYGRNQGSPILSPVMLATFPAQPEEKMRAMRQRIHGTRTIGDVLQYVVPVIDDFGNTRSQGEVCAVDEDHDFETKKQSQNQSTLGVGNKSVSKRHCSTESTSNAEFASSSSAQRKQRRQWPSATFIAANASSKLGKKLDNGTPSENRRSQSTSESRKSGYCGIDTKNRHRSGRSVAHDESGSGERLSQTEVPGNDGLDCASIQERGSASEPVFYQETGPEDCGQEVFNIETTTGNYFAEGLLVHNSHRAKSYNSKCSLFAADVRRHSGRRLCLSGTPLPHSVLDAFGQYRFLDPAIFGTSYHRFRSEFAVQNPNIPEMVIGWKNLDEFSRRFGLLAYRIEADVLKLPDPTHSVVPVKLERKARTVYDDLEKESITEVEGGTITVGNVLTKTIRHRQVVSGFCVRDNDKAMIELGDEKQRALVDLLADLPPREPAVVFCEFIHDLDCVEKAASDLGRRYGELSGRRRDMTENATLREDIDLMGVQCRAGGVGIDFTRACYAVVWGVGYLSPGEYEQLLCRIHRPGQERLVTFYHLIAEDTIDEAIVEARLKKADVIEAVMERLRRKQ